ncbi:MAG TPA: flagellar hook-basal body protein [Solirubrobacteraceae bacterium]|nr:flagellar hook-basal body protein [Solirubrobacteraceae bacterium]
MDIGLAIAAQGMLAEQVRQNELSNDLANGSTPGYKPQLAEQRSFDSILLQNTATGQTIGPINAGVDIARTVTDTTAAPLEQTGQALDFGIAGDGYFAVRTAQGVRYTQDGRFSIDAKNQLVDANGDPVLSQSGQPITAGPGGTVKPTSLGVFNLTNVAEQGNNLFTGTATGRAAGVVHSGELEQSGVDSISTMTDMIASLRAYQAGQSAIQSIDHTMQENAQSTAAVPGG